MFKKILIADDIDSVNLGVKSLLEKETSVEIDHVRYCDDAILKIKKAVRDGFPYELLISDLSFKQDHREVRLAGGEELIAAARKEQPEIKVIAYSVDERNFRIKSLFDTFEVDAFVSKGRDGSAQLSNAIKTIYDSDRRYISPHLNHLLADSSALEIDENDVEVLHYLSKGMSQEEIAKTLQQLKRTSSSLSSMEKRINKLKIVFKARNLAHLVSIAKDMGLI